jgi:hypothetical protein
MQHPVAAFMVDMLRGKFADEHRDSSADIRKRKRRESRP